jgi:pilus assembly protein CpaE
VQLLASSPLFDQTLSPDNTHLLRVMKVLKEVSPLTVLDAPHLLEPHFSPLLQLLDKIVLVLTPDMPSVQSTAIALQGLLRLGIATQQIKLVVNQVSPYHTLPVETIQKAIKRQVAAFIPFEAEMVKSVNSGKPLLLNHPKSAATVAIGKLAGSILA